MAFSYHTTKREERLFAATPEALETERASIQRSAESLAVSQVIGLVDQGGLVMERELIDWRVDTFNRTLAQRLDVTIEPIESTVLYAEAAEKATDRRIAAEESFYSQWMDASPLEPVAPESKEGQLLSTPGQQRARTMEERKQELQTAERERSPLYFQYGNDAQDFAATVDGPFSFRVPNGSQSALLYATIPNPKQPHECVSVHDPEQLEQRLAERRDFNRTLFSQRESQRIGPTEQMTASLAQQETSIREEWLSDLQSGRLSQQALDSYFAGRVDQHNALIEMALAAHPELRETLPPPIQYDALRAELQQQVKHAPQEDLVTAYQQRELTIAGLQQQQIDTLQAIIRQSQQEQLSIQPEQHAIGIAV